MGSLTFLGIRPSKFVWAAAILTIMFWGEMPHAGGQDLVMVTETIMEGQNLGHYPLSISATSAGGIYIPVSRSFRSDYVLYSTPQGWQQVYVPGDDRIGDVYSRVRSDGTFVFSFNQSAGSNHYVKYAQVYDGQYTELASFACPSGKYWTNRGLAVSGDNTPFFAQTYENGHLYTNHLYTQAGTGFAEINFDFTSASYPESSQNQGHVHIVSKDDTIAVAWTLGRDWGAGRALFAKTSTDGGTTWSGTQVIQHVNENLGFKNVVPRINSDGLVGYAALGGNRSDGNLHITYYDTDGLVHDAFSIYEVIASDHWRFWDWGYGPDNVPYFLIQTYTIPSSGGTTRYRWGPIGEVDTVLTEFPSSYISSIGALTFDEGQNPHVVITEGHWNTNARMLYYRFLEPGPQISRLTLASATGAETGGELTTETRQNAIVYKTGLEPPSTRFRTYPVDNGTLSAGEIDNLKDMYAGQFSYLGKSEMQGSGDYWANLHQWRLGEREETLNATLEGTFRINDTVSEARQVELTLTVDGRAVGRGSRIIDDLGGSLRFIADSAIAKSAALATGIKSVLVNELVAYGVDATADWSLDQLITEYETKLDEASSSAFKASYGGQLRIDPEGDGTFVEVASVHEGFDTWENSWLSIPEKEDGPVSDTAPFLTVNTNESVPFEISVDTLAATAGSGCTAAGVIRGVTLEVVDTSDPFNPAIQQTWVVSGDEVYPQLYRDADQNYEQNQFNEWLVGTTMSGLGFLHDSVFAVSTKFIESGTDMGTGNSIDLSPLNAFDDFAADQSGVLGHTDSPAFYSHALDVPQEAETLIVEYGLLSATEIVDPGGLVFSVWMDDNGTTLDLIEVDFADLTFTNITAVDGLTWFGGSAELRLDLVDVVSGTKSLNFLLDTTDGSTWEGAFIIDGVYVTVPDPALGDTNGDGIVDISDYENLVAQFGGYSIHRRCEKWLTRQLSYTTAMRSTTRPARMSRPVTWWSRAT